MSETYPLLWQLYSRRTPSSYDRVAMSMSHKPDLKICPYNNTMVRRVVTDREFNHSLTVPTLLSGRILHDSMFDFLLACRRLENADFTLLKAVVQRSHELQLDVIRLVWMVKFLGALHV